MVSLIHLSNVEERFCCPQAFLILDFQCKNDVLGLKRAICCRKWPAEDLARMLMGEEDTQHQSVLQSAPFIFACMAKPLADRALVRQDIAIALAQASLQPFLTHLTGQQLAWLQRHMQLTAESHAQVSLLPHFSKDFSVV